VLLVFVPVAVQIGGAFAVDPFQLGLIMVMANQIGATTPPMAPLLFVTTSRGHLLRPNWCSRIRR
jgi:TRAP-type C4-dicarboxylate transport system permease large subunit